MELPPRVQFDYGFDWPHIPVVWNIGVFIEGQYVGPDKKLEWASRLPSWVEPKKMWRLANYMNRHGFVYVRRSCEYCGVKLSWMPKKNRFKKTCLPCRGFEKELRLFFRRRTAAIERGWWNPEDTSIWPSFIRKESKQCMVCGVEIGHLATWRGRRRVCKKPECRKTSLKIMKQRGIWKHHPK